jgi:hypothetical protein
MHLNDLPRPVTGTEMTTVTTKHVVASLKLCDIMHVAAQREPGSTYNIIRKKK